MKIFQIICLLVSLQMLPFQPKAQTPNTCNCALMLDPDFKGRIGLYDNTGKLIRYLKHNLKEEDFIVFEVREEKDSMLNVSAIYSLAGTRFKGWVKKSKVIGTYFASYSGKIPIYEEPTKNAKKSIIPEWSNEFVVVTACKGDWVRISVLQHGKIYAGWLPREAQCPDPYTTCS